MKKAYNLLVNYMKSNNILYSMLLFVLLMLFATVYAKSYKNSSELNLIGKVIFIDPGHGGRDSGTTYGKILEKDINLQISLALQEELGKQGAIVYMTRDKDDDLSSEYDYRKKRGDLYRRILKISEPNVHTDLYLSIHINWFNNPYWGGAEVLYNSINPNNKKLGEIILNNLKKDTGTKRALKTTDLYMYKNISIPGVLIECGFLSNYKDRTSMQNKKYQILLAKSITNSVIEYFNTY